MRSDDGGFGFSGYDDASFAGTDAGGYRADVSLGLGDFFDRARGRVTIYTQSLDGGYSAPGLQTLTDAENYGGTFQMPMTERLSLRAKSDHRSAELGLTASAHELNVAYELNDNWGVATGVRVDERRDDSAVVPLTQEQGERTDAVVQVGYDSKRRWSAYGFVQDTVSVDGDREENARIGTGGSYRISRAPEDRRRGLERRFRRRRQDRHELSAQRPHDAVLELRARERAHRQRLARRRAAAKATPSPA